MSAGRVGGTVAGVGAEVEFRVRAVYLESTSAEPSEEGRWGSGSSGVVAQSAALASPAGSSGARSAPPSVLRWAKMTGLHTDTFVGL